MIKSVFFAAALAALHSPIAASPAAAQTQASPNVGVTIRADAPGAKIDRRLFGQFQGGSSCHSRSRLGRTL